jgi:superfamily II DNA or RNA helicase
MSSVSTPAAIPEHRYATGARVEIRDEEWMVRGVQRTVTGAHALRVVGVSDLVRGRDAVFLDDLDRVTVLDPRETELIHDPSPRHRRTALYLESLLRQSPPTTAELAIGHRGAMQPARYQLVPAAKALAQPRARILIADGVGLGKTIEVGILLAELIRRGRGRGSSSSRCAPCSSNSRRSYGHASRSRSSASTLAGIQRVQQRIPANMNPFHFYDRAIISIDTLKKDEKYRRYLQDCRWDAIVIDECQHVAERGATQGDTSMRARLARLLAHTCDALILTSATPHDGRPESFASLMNLLDPTAIADPSRFTNAEIGGLYVRRFKKDIEHEVGASFHDRRLIPRRVPATPAEDALFHALHAAEFKTLGRQKQDGTFAGASALFTTLLRKAALSSASALLTTLTERARHPRLLDPAKGATTPEAAHDRALLDRLSELARAAAGAAAAPPSKLAALLDLLRGAGVADPTRDERVVIFSERLDTLAVLQDSITSALRLPPAAVGLFTGALDDQAQQALVKDFGSHQSPLRVLLASDAAAEGINLHFYCHRLVHFDIPWSLITLEQRNGRIDRYGQTREPEIHYLLTIPTDERLRGDLRVLDRLVEKEHEAHKNLGDVRTLLRLHDPDAEEAHIAEGVAAGLPAEAIIPDLPDPDDLSAEGLDFLAALAALQTQGEAERAEVAIAAPRALYTDDLTFTVDAFQELAAHHPEIHEARRHPEASGVEIEAPPDLLRRCELLPPELQRQPGRFKLTTDRAFLMSELQRARERSDAWPEWHLLWELHPLSEWLCDRLVAHMSRHAAPIVRVPRGVAAHTATFLVQAVLANGRSQPILNGWFGVDLPLSTPPKNRATAPTPPPIRELPELITALGLDRGLANDGARPDPAPLLPLRALAVAAARDHMQRLRDQRATELGAQVRAETRRLSTWADHRLDQLDRSLTAEARPAHRSRLAQERQDIEALRDQRQAWVREALATDSEPYIRLAAVFVSPSHPTL